MIEIILITAVIIVAVFWAIHLLRIAVFLAFYKAFTIETMGEGYEEVKTTTGMKIEIVYVPKEFFNDACFFDLKTVNEAYEEFLRDGVPVGLTGFPK